MNEAIKTDNFAIKCDQQWLVSPDLSTIYQQYDVCDRLASLNSFETEVLLLRLQNLSIPEVAERLEIDPSAAESHCIEILTKLKVKTLIQALNLVDVTARLTR